jgi:acetoin utilization deacetylase AcuC-like enzyme
MWPNVYKSSSVNVPWPCAGVGDADYIHAFQKIILPIGLEFAPDLVMSKSTPTGIIGSV